MNRSQYREFTTVNNDDGPEIANMTKYTQQKLTFLNWFSVFEKPAQEELRKLTTGWKFVLILQKNIAL